MLARFLQRAWCLSDMLKLRLSCWQGDILSDLVTQIWGTSEQPEQPIRWRNGLSFCSSSVHTDLLEQQQLKEVWGSKASYREWRTWEENTQNPLYCQGGVETLVSLKRVENHFNFGFLRSVILRMLTGLLGGGVYPPGHQVMTSALHQILDQFITFPERGAMLATKNSKDGGECEVKGVMVPVPGSCFWPSGGIQVQTVDLERPYCISLSTSSWWLGWGLARASTC